MQKASIMVHNAYVWTLVQKAVVCEILIALCKLVC